MKTIEIRRRDGGLLYVCEAEDMAEAAERAAGEGVQMRGADFYKADLRGADLRGAEKSTANRSA